MLHLAPPPYHHHHHLALTRIDSHHLALTRTDSHHLAPISHHLTPTRTTPHHLVPPRISALHHLALTCSHHTMLPPDLYYELYACVHKVLSRPGPAAGRAANRKNTTAAAVGDPCSLLAARLPLLRRSASNPLPLLRRSTPALYSGLRLSLSVKPNHTLTLR